MSKCLVYTVYIIIYPKKFYHCILYIQGVPELIVKGRKTPVLYRSKGGKIVYKHMSVRNVLPLNYPYPLKAFFKILFCFERQFLTTKINKTHKNMYIC